MPRTIRARVLLGSVVTILVALAVVAAAVPGIATGHETEARGLHPLSIQAMAEFGFDISMQESKTIDRFADEQFDLLITVCDEANEACPYFANARQRRHWSFPDPSAVAGDDDARFAAFADVRDAIRARIERELLAVPSR